MFSRSLNLKKIPDVKVVNLSICFSLQKSFLPSKITISSLALIRKMSDYFINFIEAMGLVFVSLQKTHHL